MRSLSVILALSASLATTHTLGAQPGRGGGTPIKPGEQCPAGMTEIRPNLCQAPQLPAPSIVDYRPKSTLVAPVHLVPQSKYPSIDFHGRQRLV